MELLEGIRSRRSISRVKPDPVDKALIERILEAGAWAPNHHLTEPWRFIVMTGDGRQRLADAYADVAAAGADPGLSAETLAELKNKQSAKAYRAPVVIAVLVSPAADSAAPLVEEQAAVHAAIQNMLLAAHALGLGAIWRTGAPAYHPLMHAAFGLKPAETLAGFLYIGYPDMDPPAGRRTDFRAKTEWWT